MIGQPCKYGDPACPCQDGDACHYEGRDAIIAPRITPEDAIMLQAIARERERSKRKVKHRDSRDPADARVILLMEIQKIVALCFQTYIEAQAKRSDQGFIDVLTAPVRFAWPHEPARPTVAEVMAGLDPAKILERAGDQMWNNPIYRRCVDIAMADIAEEVRSYDDAKDRR
jgi:hypothetical protein